MIGAYEYSDLDDLPSVQNNLKRIPEIFANPSVWGIPSENITAFVQPEEYVSVVDAVQVAAQAADDTLIVYYSGHGLVAPDTLDLHLATVQSRVGAEHTSLPYDWIRKPIIKSRAQRKIVILDCCYSGRAFKGLSAGGEIADDAVIEGTYILAAAAETKKALAPAGETYTAFTGELIRLIEKGIPGGAPLIDVHTLYKELASTLKGKGRPEPQQRNRNSVSEISFARNIAYKADGDLGVVEGEKNRVARLWSLGEALLLRAQSGSNSAELMRAINVLRSAYEQGGRGNEGVASLVALGNALRLKAELWGDLVSLDESIILLRRAAAIGRPDNVDRSVALTALADALRVRAKLTSDSSALDEAVALLRSAVAATPDGSAARGESLLLLGDTLRESAVQNRLETGASRTAEAAWQECMKSAAVPVRLRIDAAMHLGHSLAERGEVSSATDAMALAIALLPLVASRRLDASDREKLLAKYLGLASDAAYLALRSGDVERAASLLEQGRGILLNQVIEGKADIQVLADLRPDLATRYNKISDILAAQWSRPTWVESQRDTAAQGYEISDFRHDVAQQWEDLIAEIRLVPQMQSFLLQPSQSEMRKAASIVPIVIVNVSRYGADALIIKGEGFSCVTLPDLRLEDVRTYVAPFLTEGGVFERRDSLLAGDRWEVRATTALEWLWKVVALPVLDAIGCTDKIVNGVWPRICWCMTGLLSFMPIHAAGTYRDDRLSGESSTVMDRVVSSYTSTVGSLVYGLQRRKVSSPESRKVLVVGVSNTPGSAPLPGAEAEASSVASLFSGTQFLLNGAATLNAVKAALPTANWAHFACHASSNFKYPLRGGLVLADGTLDIGQAFRLDLPSAELIVLSGCETAKGVPLLPDEALHVASAFQIAGFKHVVASMWALADGPAVRMARGFYESLQGLQNNDPAGALHMTLHAARSRWSNNPFVWAALAHFGPSHPDAVADFLWSLPPKLPDSRDVDEIIFP
ncbi:CHAT domain-containing protein [Frankia sp. CcI49]|uniref:caspase, EACC1-associated type n=1 Tax=Frankia sp. CcI49 TaxID=1745382 RepID=UPI0013040A49|nr:CHAT domain-containing protein [Frankia sp. CcI49]